MNDIDRRRLVLAALVTAIAVPAFLFFSRDDGGDTGEAATATVAAGNVINPVEGQNTQVETTEPAPGSESQRPDVEAPDDDPIFMNGPVAIEEDEIAEVAIPAQPSIAPVMIDATYRSTVPGTRTCLVRGIASGRTVRVTNLDNGRSVTCVTVVAPRTQSDELVMHTDAFSQLADLTDAPIAVEVSQ